MIHEISKSNIINVPPFLEQAPDERCHCQTRNGRCTMPVSDPSSGFCLDHARPRRKSQNPDPADLSAELTAGLADFKSAEAVNQFLSRLLILQAQGRIAPRRAAVMIFNCNQLLHFLGFIVREKAAEPTQIVFDIPCAVGTRAQAQP